MISFTRNFTDAAPVSIPTIFLMTHAPLVLHAIAILPPKEGGLVKDVVTYMVMDDLLIMPMSIITCVTMINSMFNMKDVGALEEKVVTFGMDEVNALSFSFVIFLLK